ncbi:hypothetical protein E3P92_01470 [Wallemia ichthyophaga]|uniref:Uncharacterized protein n=2 Tax=Wallemia ichthyophaga TaxID=245174 RepID=A0A4T0K771_WALIC|nr:UPF0136 membrane protein YJRC [Wallemia ichthyophaga EXF-994]TIA73965.1 hypothetical protein E3P91_01135 [Wallemia ichthyophaga]EOR00299.1 UPF0136 membrane protein YJRC [Wallemia ichthyophaga EXF-994]TIA82558.1 hypothetical protein E3P98_01275 [Wallemia ichthyophaga]TIA92406.1 hypothetical protein E3P97_01440 [Wallemia ichthyophaga]TIB01542.1 hypothetical protein E3P95_01277 [Wallemia ichthyophaga]
MSHHLAFSLAGLTGLGGAMGFIKKGSKASLFGGLLTSAAFASSGYLIQQNMDYGFESALAASALLTASSIGRVRASALPKMLTALGLTSGAYYAYKIKQFQDGF